MKRHFPYILAIILLTILAWHKVLRQSFMGEGFYYFNNTFSNVGMVDGLVRYDTLARLIFEFLPRFFADNIPLYMGFMLIIVSLVNIFYYFLVYALSEKRIIGLIASVFFIVNYVTSYEIFSIGNYQFFAQRIPNFILVFFSFILLVKFLKKKAGKFSYLSSVSLYLLAVLLAQFSIFFLPMFVFYPLALWLERRKDCRSLFLTISLVISFVGGTAVLLWLDKIYGSSVFIKDNSFFQFIFHRQTILEDVVYQLPWAIFPLPILKLFGATQGRLSSIAISIPLVILGLVLTRFIHRREITLRAVVLSAVLFIPTTLLLNVYLQALQVYRFYDTSRYLYVPWMASAVFLAIILYVFFYKRGRLGRLFVICLIACWAFLNLNLIWTKMDGEQKRHFANKSILAYVKEKSFQYPDDALVILPDIIGYHGADFCKKFYGREEMRFAPMFADWNYQLGENFDLGRLIVLDYDYEKKEVLDRTEEFRRLLKAKKF